MVHVYHYPNCGTCRKALAWLEQRGTRFEKSDLVAERIPLAKLKDLVRRSGLPMAKSFNTSGESYRNGGFKDRMKTMSEAEALEALAADGKLIKRPIVDTGKDVLVGFDEDAYAERI